MCERAALRCMALHHRVRPGMPRVLLNYVLPTVRMYTTQPPSRPGACVCTPVHTVSTLGPALSLNLPKL